MSNFLFGMDDYVGPNAWRATWVKAEVGKPFSFTSRADLPLTCALHWFRRAYLCAGPDACPACRESSPRPMTYLFGGSMRNTFVLELNHSSFLKCLDDSNQLSSPIGDNIMGRKFSVVRPSKKKPLQITALAQDESVHKIDRITEAHCLFAFARLFSLQIANNSANIDTVRGYLVLAAARALEPVVKEAARLQ